MASSIVSLPFLVQSPRSTLSALPKLSASKIPVRQNQAFLLKRGPGFHLPFSLTQSNGVLGVPSTRKYPVPERRLYSICFYNPKEESKSSFIGKVRCQASSPSIRFRMGFINVSLLLVKQNDVERGLEADESKGRTGSGNARRLDFAFDSDFFSPQNFGETGLDWPILKRWDVPWQWQTVSLSMFACAISFVLTGLVQTVVLSYLGLKVGELSSDEKAELLFVDQAILTAIVLGVIYGFTSTFQPLPDDIFCYDRKKPFSLRKGWLLWAGVGLVGSLLAIALTGAVMTFFSGESPQRETDALVRLLPLIGSSSISTACLVGITGVLAPMLEETVFRGFVMVSLTKWFPTPISVLLSAALFAIAHLTPGEFPQLFVLGIALGFSYAQTRNLLTPITIHALWNSGVILILTFLQLQGYDIRELLQAS